MKTLLCIFLVCLTVVAVAAFPGSGCPGPLENSGSSITVNFTLWFPGPHGDVDPVAHALQVVVPKGATYYQMMLIAALADPVYQFDSKFFVGLGHYITAFNGVFEDVPNNIFWMLYLLPSPPDTLAHPSDSLLTPKGVDGMICQDGDQILFWLHKFVSPGP